MGSAGASMPFMNSILLSSANKQFRGVDDLGKRFTDAAGMPRPSFMIWLRTAFERTAIQMQGVKFASLQQRLRQTAARELKANLRRLEELSPHLLDDIGVRKLETGDSELLLDLYPTDRTAPASAHDVSLPPDNNSSPARLIFPSGVTG